MTDKIPPIIALFEAKASMLDAAGWMELAQGKLSEGDIKTASRAAEIESTR